MLSLIHVIHPLAAPHGQQTQAPPGLGSLANARKLHAEGITMLLRHSLRQSLSEVRSLAVCAGLLQQSLHTANTPRWVADPEPSSGAEQQQPHRRHAPGAAPAGRQPQDALTVQRPVTLLERALAMYNTAANAVNRVLMLVSSLRHHSANEEYVMRYLERALGMDTFTVRKTSFLS